MSYARWSKHSDVYVFAASPTGVMCCGCNLHTYPHDAHSIVFDSAEDVAAHMREHVAEGDVIPDHLLDPGTYDPDDFNEAES